MCSNPADVKCGDTSECKINLLGVVNDVRMEM